MGISHEPPLATEMVTLTPLGEACSRLDLTAIHEILEKVGYKDDEGIANEVSNILSIQTCSLLIPGSYLDQYFARNRSSSITTWLDLNSLLCKSMLLALQLSFQMWTDQIQETLNSKKRGDAAFRAKDFVTAIDCYTHVSNYIPLLTQKTY